MVVFARRKFNKALYFNVLQFTPRLIAHQCTHSLYMQLCQGMCTAAPYQTRDWTSPA